MVHSVRIILTAILIINIGTVSELAEAEVIQKDYDGFTVWVDCERRGAIKFSYKAKKDKGNLPRRSSFKPDPDFPAECQQKKGATYKHSGVKYDRGHLVPANHLDHLKDGIYQSNFMTNILPQVSTMNRGAWLLTEEIIECYRDKEDLRIMGGVIYGHNPDDDYFLKTHGVETPDYFWKVIAAKNRAIAWLVPNSPRAKKKRLDKYLISISDLEVVIDEKINIAKILKEKPAPSKSWKLPTGCDRS